MRISGKEKSNSGFSLIELIIVIAIMGVLTGILAPTFIKYVEKSKKAKDVYTAAQIARAVNIAFVENPEAYEAFQKWGVDSDPKYKNPPTASKAAVTVKGTYLADPVWVVASSGTQSSGNTKSNCFNGTAAAFNGGDKYGNLGFYGVVNRELGLSTTKMNSSIVPKYTQKKEGSATSDMNGKPYQNLDRWRICKRKDNGAMEIWVAQPDPWGGYPVYRLWPEPDDFYTQ